jgi:hypothetical protein
VRNYCNREKIIDIEELADLHVFRLSDYENVFSVMPSGKANTKIKEAGRYNVDSLDLAPGKDI